MWYKDSTYKGEKIMKQIGMIGVLSNPAKKDSSHNGGWTRVLKSILEIENTKVVIANEKDDWSQFDELYINEGVNYKEGVYNLFGGVSDAIIKKLNMLNDFQGDVWTYGDFIDYKDFCNKRNIEMEFTKKITFKDLVNANTKNLVYGDSHSISVFNKGYAISRNDGSTLWGMLNKELTNLIPKNLDKLTFYAGNIDVRHHILRNTNIVDIDEYLLKNYIEPLRKQLNELECKEITLVELLPIENESRKIPTTGCYQNSAFYGSWYDRTQVVKSFNRQLRVMCNVEGHKLLAWPEEFKNDLGELKFEVMEARQSVHLAPSSYYYADKFIYREQLNLF